LLGPFVPVDDPTSSRLTQERLGWRPTQPELIPDIDRPIYFKASGDRVPATTLCRRYFSYKEEFHLVFAG
jgi:hypothetical protein